MIVILLLSLECNYALILKITLLSVCMLQYIYVTRSDKTGFITLVSSFDFSSQTQRYMNKLLNFTFTTSFHSVVCFSWLLFKNTVVICASSQGCKYCPGWRLGGFEWLYSLMMLNKPSCNKFPLISARFET